MHNDFYTFGQARSHYLTQIQTATLIHSGSWQSMDISDNPQAEMRELLFESFSIKKPPVSLKDLRVDLQPNLPWADDHFMKERVGEEPLNPGKEWKNWPWAKSADTFRTESKFSHTYAERFWPMFAGRTMGGLIPPESQYYTRPTGQANRGIRYRYGDLLDVIYLLLRDPLTRQAIIPIFFPEDTGAHHKDRIPCTIAYQVIRRDDKLHLYYFIRSCDLIRHWADDCYMAVRLQMWMLDRLKEIEPISWNDVKLGEYHMHMTSLHCFKSDLP